MRPESLRLLQKVVRINPAAKIAAIAREHPRSKDELAEALIDAYVEVISGGARVFTALDWDDFLGALGRDTSTLAEFMDSNGVRALVRAQETHANP